MLEYFQSGDSWKAILTASEHSVDAHVFTCPHPFPSCSSTTLGLWNIPLQHSSGDARITSWAPAPSPSAQLPLLLAEAIRSPPPSSMQQPLWRRVFSSASVCALPNTLPANAFLGIKPADVRFCCLQTSTWTPALSVTWTQAEDPWAGMWQVFAKRVS